MAEPRNITEHLLLYRNKILQDVFSGIIYSYRPSLCVQYIGEKRLGIFGYLYISGIFIISQ
jgi:hypothetical protein